jgi:DNA transposition AAA+ family ATPase
MVKHGNIIIVAVFILAIFARRSVKMTVAILSMATFGNSTNIVISQNGQGKLKTQRNFAANFVFCLSPNNWISFSLN